MLKVAQVDLGVQLVLGVWAVMVEVGILTVQMEILETMVIQVAVVQRELMDQYLFKRSGLSS
jgi:hypothetical protein